MCVMYCRRMLIDPIARFLEFLNLRFILFMQTVNHESMLECINDLNELVCVSGVAGERGRGVGPDAGAPAAEADVQAGRLPVYPSGRLHH